MHNNCKNEHNKIMIVFKIKNIRESKNITIYQLSKSTNISRTYLRMLENNKKSNPTLQTLCKIAVALNVNVKDLFDFVP